MPENHFDERTARTYEATWPELFDPAVVDPAVSFLDAQSDGMINVCFAGVTGWTASPIVAAIDRADDLTLTAGVSRSAAGKSLAERPAPRAVRTPEPAVPLGELHGPVEARGAEVAGSRIHSVRLPSFVVSTEIVFGGPGERLVMRHDPGTDPSPYVAGTLPAVRHAGEETGVRRGLDSLLFRG